MPRTITLPTSTRAMARDILADLAYMNGAPLLAAVIARLHLVASGQALDNVWWMVEPGQLVISLSLYQDRLRAIATLAEREYTLIASTIGSETRIRQVPYADSRHTYIEWLKAEELPVDVPTRAELRGVRQANLVIDGMLEAGGAEALSPTQRAHAAGLLAANGFHEAAEELLQFFNTPTRADRNMRATLAGVFAEAPQLAQLVAHACGATGIYQWIE